MNREISGASRPLPRATDFPVSIRRSTLPDRLNTATATTRPRGTHCHRRNGLYPSFVICDGSLLRWTPAQAPAGFNFAGLVPTGLSPISIMLQGFCLAPNLSNPYFTTTDAYEIRVQ